jgi:prepilin-type N-terminal cleavage/methylation domain-containing protein
MGRASGFTLVELMMVLALLALVLAVAVPSYRRAKQAGNEAGAISALEAINNAQAIFKSVCGHERYAPDLPSLGVPIPSSGQAFLTPDLTAAPEVFKSGYVIRMAGEPIADAPAACNGALPAAGYIATADPAFGGPGARFFGTNASRAIYEHTETLTGQMPESGAPPAGRELGATTAAEPRPAPPQQSSQP